MTISSKTLLASQDAFTLVELLAMIAILAVLTVIAIPALASMASKSKETESKNNLRQIGFALFNYAAENNGCLPPVSTSWPPPTHQRTMWGYSIWTYAGYNEAAFTSPSNDLRLYAQRTPKNIFRNPANAPSSEVYPSGQPIHPWRMSYGLNSSPLGPMSAVTLTTPISLVSVQKKVTTAMVTETSFCLGSREGYRSLYGMLPHKGRANVLFYDGHVESRQRGGFPSSSSDSFWTGQ